MKSIVGFVLFLCVAASSFGTVETRTYYHHEHFELTYIHNHNYYYVKDHLYYKGIAEVLNGYVAELKKNGKLSKGPVRIEVGATVFGGLPAVRMTRSNRGYKAFFHSEPKLDYLTQVIAYFASYNWESFCYDISKVDADVARRIFNKRMMEAVGVVHVSPFMKKQKVLVYEVDEVKICWEKEQLQTYLGDIKLNVIQGQIYPFRMKNRYFLNDNDKMLVYENDALILTFPLNDRFYSDWETGYEVKIKSKWVDIEQYGNNIMSYSYNKNRFYVVPK